MENQNYYSNKNPENRLQDSIKLSLSLRKKKLNQKLCESHTLINPNLSKDEEESNNVSKLCELSKNLVAQKDNQNIINTLDKLYFFLINIKIPLKANFIKLSNIIPNLYNTIQFFERNEIVLLKIYDALEEIIKYFYYYENDDNCFGMFNDQYFQLIYRLIDLYQNNDNIMKKIFNFLSDLIKKSDFTKEYLMTKPGCYFIQSILSLDNLYTTNIIQILSSFCNYENLCDEKMKNFEMMFIQECDKILTLFYHENLTDPKIVINNNNLFKNLYSCFSFISISELNEVKNKFFIDDKKYNVNLLEKIMEFEKLDRENLAGKVLRILVNLFCSSDKRHIQILIENKSYQYVMDRLVDKFSDENIIKEASTALSNFVNTEIFRKIFIENKYINDIINKLRENKSYEITKELLCVISNIIFSIEEEKIFSLIDSDLIPFCVEFLMTIKEPYLLIYLLKIIELILFKGDPNVYVDCYHKNADDKILNPFKYRFDTYGLYDILSNILTNNKNENVCNSIKSILEHYYDQNQIIDE